MFPRLPVRTIVAASIGILVLSTLLAMVNRRDPVARAPAPPPTRSAPAKAEATVASKPATQSATTTAGSNPATAAPPASAIKAIAPPVEPVADVLAYLRTAGAARNVYVPSIERVVPAPAVAATPSATTLWRIAVAAYTGRTAVAAGDALTLHMSAVGSAAVKISSVAIVEAASLKRVHRHVVQPIDVAHKPCASYRDGGCAFATTLRVPTDALANGLYFALIERDDVPLSEEIYFIVRPLPKDAPRARVAVLAPEFTWQAYNRAGGHSFYTDQKAGQTYQVSLQRPVPSAPDNDYHNARTLLPFIRELSAMGIEPWLLTSIDLHEHAEALDGVDLLLVTGHDEYWSGPMRDRFDDHLRRGGRVAIFSGNAMWWKVNIDGDIMAMSQKDSADSNTARFKGTGLWIRPWVDRPTVPSIGLTYYVGGVPVWSAFSRDDAVKAGLSIDDYRNSTKMRVTDPGHPIYAGTDLRTGSWFGGDSPLMLVEVDSVLLRGDGMIDNTTSTKFPHMNVLASAFVHDPSSGAGNGRWPQRIVHSGIIAEVKPPFGGRVLHLGSIGWFSALDGRDPTVARIFRNTIDYMRRP